MRKLVIVLLAVVVAIGVGALVSVSAWSSYQSRQVESEASDFEAWSKSQRVVPVEFTVTAPAETPGDQTLYLSGSAPALGAWEAAGVPLEKGSDGMYHATVELMSGIEHQFKVTRGTWGTVERGAGGAEIGDHTFTPAATQPDKVRVAVATWVDGGKSVPGRITVAGQVRLHKKWHSKVLNNDRTLAVYLPPNYDQEKSARYPVLYLQDGQNLFDESTAFAGVEWGVDEAAEGLIKAGRIEPVIIVGVYNTEQRTEEFTPPGMGAKASGEKYAKMMVEEVKPFIDEHYRTRADRGHTGIGGSSMGGLIALYTAKTHPDTYGQVALLTPWLRTQTEAASADLARVKADKLWIDMGSAGGTNYPGPDAMADARAFVKSTGLTEGPGFKYVEIEGGEHNEAAWAGRIDQVLEFLYGKTPAQQ